jgi:tRNA pseudouridine55 synthase
MASLEDYTAGKVILIDKPLHWTSFQAVNKIRWAIKKRFGIKKIKVGHAGTLDPLATGLLVICTGKMTKQINTFQGQEKAYIGTITLGSTTPSYDLETEFDKTFDTSHITEDLIHNTSKQFTGSIEQYPPIFSALKKDGKRLYDIARAGESVKLNTRTVEITTFEITEINGLNLKFKIVCSKGTYIRSLAHDFGKALNCGAHLSELRRTRIGSFSVEKAISPEAFLDQLS